MRAARSGLYRNRDGGERLWFSPADIETMAEDALRQSGVFPTAARPAVDVERLVQGLGARLDQHATLDKSVLGQTEFYTDAPPKVSINADLTGAIDDDHTPPGIRGRWRATIAHESAHVFLHRILFEIKNAQEQLFPTVSRSEPQRLMRCLKQNVLFRGGGASDWREVQANMGMAALLMPQALFRELAVKFVQQRNLPATTLVPGSQATTMLTAEMAALFDVSKQAAAIRLETLRVVSSPGQEWLIHEAG